MIIIGFVNIIIFCHCGKNWRTNIFIMHFQNVGMVTIATTELIPVKF